MENCTYGNKAPAYGTCKGKWDVISTVCKFVWDLTKQNGEAFADVIAYIINEYVTAASNQ